MTSIFNYNTISAKLLKETKSLQVTLNRPEVSHAIDLEMIFELESLLSWVSNHLEINSILLDSTGPIFSRGIDHQVLTKMTENNVKKLLVMTQKLIFAMFCLPQTIIIDLKGGASNIASELAIGADIRIAQEDCHINFEHLKIGLVPASGGIGFLSAIIPKATARNWALSSRPASSKELKESGFIAELYPKSLDTDIYRSKYLEEIANQSPVSRIQAKRSFLESIMPELERALEYEKSFAFAGLCTGDWRKNTSSKSDESFYSPRDLAMELKKSQRPVT